MFFLLPAPLWKFVPRLLYLLSTHFSTCQAFPAITLSTLVIESIPIRFGWPGIAELYSAKIREAPKMPSTTRAYLFVGGERCVSNRPKNWRPHGAILLPETVHRIRCPAYHPPTKRYGRTTRRSQGERSTFNQMYSACERPCSPSMCRTCPWEK
ncbi:MAG: hypothetical protein BECKG1743F_GA0114225_105841 [Candidatus Kentron sp. G]|nr:MAG: hypothetical protein BECKG1743F_GA0114225_105841 [Candidatus Kentron sp. G]